MNATDQPPVRYLYTFLFENGMVRKFDVVLDGETLQFIPKEGISKPHWTKLAYNQCESCPLSASAEYCPVAVNLSNVVETFKDSISFENTTVTVETTERSFVKLTTLQKGLSSLIGVIMVTSGCPIMDKLRPMARFHLPFATIIETFYRALSMYLTVQYFLMRKGRKTDWGLNELIEIYKAISLVNKGMSRRLSSASTKDANINALVILHAFGEAVPYFVENSLNEIEKFFSVYLEQYQDIETS